MKKVYVIGGDDRNDIKRLTDNKEVEVVRLSSQSLVKELESELVKETFTFTNIPRLKYELKIKLSHKRPYKYHR